MSGPVISTREPPPAFDCIIVHYYLLFIIYYYYYYYYYYLLLVLSSSCSDVKSTAGRPRRQQSEWERRPGSEAFRMEWAFGCDFTGHTVYYSFTCSFFRFLLSRSAVRELTYLFVFFFCCSSMKRTTAKAAPALFDRTTPAVACETLQRVWERIQRGDVPDEADGFPFLLPSSSAEMPEAAAFGALPELPEPLRRTAAYEARGAKEPLPDFPANCQFNVIEADVRRTLWDLYPDEVREEMRKHLQSILTRLFFHTPPSSYTQGMNDLVAHIMFLLCTYRAYMKMESEETAAKQQKDRLELTGAVCRRLLFTLWRPYSASDLREVDAMAYSFHELLRLEHKPLWRKLEQLGLLQHPHYLLSWMLTWFMSGIKNIPAKMVLLTHLLRSPDVLEPIYLGSAMLIDGSDAFLRFLKESKRSVGPELFGPAFQKLSEIPSAIVDGDETAAGRPAAERDAAAMARVERVVRSGEALRRRYHFTRTEKRVGNETKIQYRCGYNGKRRVNTLLFLWSPVVMCILSMTAYHFALHDIPEVEMCREYVRGVLFSITSVARAVCAQRPWGMKQQTGGRQQRSAGDTGDTGDRASFRGDKPPLYTEIDFIWWSKKKMHSENKQTNNNNKKKNNNNRCTNFCAPMPTRKRKREKGPPPCVVCFECTFYSFFIPFFFCLSLANTKPKPKTPPGQQDYSASSSKKSEEPLRRTPVSVSVSVWMPHPAPSQELPSDASAMRRLAGGYTGHLLLEAPVSWWPAFGQLWEYGSETDGPAEALSAGALRAFTAALTECGAAFDPNPSAAGGQSIALSRLGRTALQLSAKWEREPVGLARRVVVRSPLTGRLVPLRVLQEPAEAAQSLAALAAADRIRIVPRQLFLRPGPEPEPEPAPEAPPVLQPTHLADASATFAAWADAFAASVAARCAGPSSMAEDEALEGCGGLFTAALCGPPGVGKRECLAYLYQQLLQRGRGSLRYQDPAAAAGESTCVPLGHGVYAVLYHRELNVEAALSVEVDEALAAVRQLLQPPPLLPRRGPPAPRGAAVAVVPLLWAELHHLDLLASRDNVAAAALSYELLHLLDRLEDRSMASFSPSVHLVAPVALWGTSLHSGAGLPVALLRRLTRHALLRLSAPPAAAVRTFLGRVAAPAPSAATGQRAATVSELLLLQPMKMSGADESAGATNEDDATLEKDAARGADPAVPASPYSSFFGLEAVVQRLEAQLVWPLTHQSLLSAYKVPCVKGALLCGPSGCGKTALLAALARRLRNAAVDTDDDDVGGVPTLHVMVRDGLRLVEKEVGRTEANIAALFHEARARSPAVIFLDNIDAIAPPRGREAAETHAASDRMLSTLLVEMDGLRGHRTGSVVVLVASAPSLERLDPAVYRAGRLDLHVHLEPPPRAVSAAAMHARLYKVVMEKFSAAALTETSRLAVREHLEVLIDQHLEARCVLGVIRDATVQLVRRSQEAAWAADPIGALDAAFSTFSGDKEAYYPYTILSSTGGGVCHEGGVGGGAGPQKRMDKNNNNKKNKTNTNTIIKILRFCATFDGVGLQGEVGNDTSAPYGGITIVITRDLFHVVFCVLLITSFLLCPLIIIIQRLYRRKTADHFSVYQYSSLLTLLQRKQLGSLCTSVSCTSDYLCVVLLCQRGVNDSTDDYIQLSISNQGLWTLLLPQHNTYPAPYVVETARALSGVKPQETNSLADLSY
eukprot:gene11824-8133_t